MKHSKDNSKISKLYENVQLPEMKTITIIQEQHETVVNLFDSTRAAIAFCGANCGSFMMPCNDFYAHVIYSSNCPQEVINYLKDLIEGSGDGLVLTWNIIFTDLNDLKAQVNKGPQ